MSEVMESAAPVAAPVADMSKLTAIYIKMRDAKAELEADIRKIEEQMDVISAHMLETLKATGQDGAKTAHGTVTKIMKTKIWTSDAEAFRNFVRENGALELFEMRIAQKNMAQWIAENPDKAHPPGLVVDNRYTIQVRRANRPDA